MSAVTSFDTLDSVRTSHQHIHTEQTGDSRDTQALGVVSRKQVLRGDVSILEVRLWLEAPRITAALLRK